MTQYVTKRICSVSMLMDSYFNRQRPFDASYHTLSELTNGPNHQKVITVLHQSIVTLPYSKFEQRCIFKSLNVQTETLQPRYFSGAKSTLTTSHHITPAAHWNMTRIRILRNLKLYNINIELSIYSNIRSQFANMFFNISVFVAELSKCLFTCHIWSFFL